MKDHETDIATLKRAWANKRKSIEPQPVDLARHATPPPTSGEDKATKHVRQMYEQFPYPSPIVGDSLISDLSIMIGLLFPGNELTGWKILDAGCGTGHRMLAMAKDYPQAFVTGLDMTWASLDVARQLAKKHRATNVELIQGNLLDLAEGERYDLIVSTGVIHHLSDPARGLRNLCRRLSDDGVILLWHYHALGEFDRLLARELILLLSGGERDSLAEETVLLSEFGFDLSTVRYGTDTSTLPSDALSRSSINADAYLHPIVNTYRFAEAVEMFVGTGLHWAAVNAVNIDGESKLIALDPDTVGILPTVTGEGLFDAPRIQDRYRRLDKMEKLRAIELALKPTGFSVIAGRNNSYRQCEPRIERNRIALQ